MSDEQDVEAGWAPDRAEDIGAAIRQALGSASMCWEHVERAGVFHPDEANRIANGLLEWVLGRYRPVDSGRSGFRAELEHLLNACSMENGSNTPDFILAGFLTECLRAFDGATAARDRGAGREAAAVCQATCSEGHTYDIRCALFSAVPVSS